MAITTKTTKQNTTEPKSPEPPSKNGPPIKTPVVSSPGLPSAASVPANTGTSARPTAQLEKPTPQLDSPAAHLPVGANVSPKHSPQAALAKDAPAHDPASDSQAAPHDETATSRPDQQQQNPVVTAHEPPPATGPAPGGATHTGVQQTGVQQTGAPRVEEGNAPSSARKPADTAPTGRPVAEGENEVSDLDIISHLILHERCEFLPLVTSLRSNSASGYFLCRIQTDRDDNDASLEIRFGRERTDRFVSEYRYLWDKEIGEDSDELGDRSFLVLHDHATCRVRCLLTTRAGVQHEIESPQHLSSRIWRETFRRGERLYAVACYSLRDVAFWLNMGVAAFLVRWLPTDPEELQAFLRPFLIGEPAGKKVDGESAENKVGSLLIQSGVLERGEAPCETFGPQVSILRKMEEAYPDIVDRIRIATHHPSWTKDFIAAEEARRPKIKLWQVENLPGVFSLHRIAGFDLIAHSIEAKKTANPAADSSRQPPQPTPTPTTNQSGLDRGEQNPIAYEDALKKVHDTHDRLGNPKSNLGFGEYGSEVVAEAKERSLVNEFRRKHSDPLRAKAEMTSDTELAVLYRSAAHYIDLCTVELIGFERELAIWSKSFVGGESNRASELLSRLREKQTASRGKSGEDFLATFIKICRRIREVESGSPSRSSPAGAARSYLPRW